MAKILVSFILFVCLNFSFAYVLLESDDPTESIIWPTEYHFKGDKLDLMTGLKEPFEIWYSAELNRSRRDYYDGTVKKYYYGETEEQMGVLYIMHPLTTEEVTNEIVCIQKEHESEQVDFMPHIKEMVFSGQEVFQDKNANVWKSKGDMDNGKMRYEKTLYVERTYLDVDIPIQYIHKIFNVDKGELEDYVIISYYDYKSSVCPDDLDAHEDEKDCRYMVTFGMNLKKDLEILHPDISLDLDLAFNSFKNHHKRDYSDDEHELRKRIFQEKWSRIVNHNRQNLGYKLEVNEFTDRTDEELKSFRGLIPSDPKESVATPFPHTLEEIEDLAKELPENFDLRLEGVVSRVKHQANCGSCWAFTTTAAVEGAVARKNGGRDLDLAEQSLVDCAWGFGNYGCDGGFLDSAMKYVLKHGIPTEEDYGGYLQMNGYCRLENVTKTYNIEGFGHVTPGSANALKVALYKYGPVGVGIYAADNLFSYSSGIYYDPACKGEGANHAVTVVGYGIQDDVTYWIVKNSWGEMWGEDGYVLISATDNICGVLDTAYYPIV